MAKQYNQTLIRSPLIPGCAIKGFQIWGQAQSLAPDSRISRNTFKNDFLIFATFVTI